MKKAILLCSFGLLGTFAMAGSSVDFTILDDDSRICTQTTTTTTTHPDGTVTTTTTTTPVPCPKTIIIIEG